MIETSLLQDTAQNLGNLLLSSSQKIACAESCTGGWMAKIITDLDGSSGWFEAGIVSYSNQAKQNFLAVSEQSLIKHGAVSRQVVEEMADGIIQKTSADFSIAVSGVAGPKGGTNEKPVGTVWLAWASKAGYLKSECQCFNGNRDDVRRQAVLFAFQGLIKYLEHG